MTMTWKDQIAQEVTAEIYQAYPWLEERFGDSGKEHTLKDNYHHLDFLESAFASGSSKVFTDYTIWLIDVLTSRHVPLHLIDDNFTRLLRHIHLVDEPEKQEFMKVCLTQAIQIVQDRSEVE